LDQSAPRYQVIVLNWAFYKLLDQFAPTYQVVVWWVQFTLIIMAKVKVSLEGGGTVTFCAPVATCSSLPCCCPHPIVFVYCRTIDLKKKKKKPVNSHNRENLSVSVLSYSVRELKKSIYLYSLLRTTNMTNKKEKKACVHFITKRMTTWREQSPLGSNLQINIILGSLKNCVRIYWHPVDDTYLNLVLASWFHMHGCMENWFFWLWQLYTKIYVQLACQAHVANH